MAQSQIIFVNHKLEFSGNSMEEYDLEDLLRSEAEPLGKGTFGFSYKAELENGNTVAVKRLKDCCLREEEFNQKIQELAKLSDHQNLLPLRAYYYSKDEKLLIFDYMPESSLASLLHDDEVAKKAKKALLTWEVRARIAYGVACTLEFLHAQGPGVCHGNIRSSNVLLTNCFDVRLSENGIFKLFEPNFKLVLIPGYQAPEVENAYDVSPKSDVYCFGVLLLELLTGKAPLEAIGKNTGVDLPSWVRDMFQERPIIDVFDSRLLHNYQNFGEQMVQFLQLAICCTFKNQSKRPSMVAVTNRIKRTCSF